MILIAQGLSGLVSILQQYIILQSEVGCQSRHTGSSCCEDCRSQPTSKCWKEYSKGSEQILRPCAICIIEQSDHFIVCLFCFYLVTCVMFVAKFSPVWTVKYFYCIVLFKSLVANSNSVCVSIPVCHTHVSSQVIRLFISCVSSSHTYTKYCCEI